MRIAMLVDVYLPFVSGVTHAVATLTRALEGLGHEVSILTSGHASSGDLSDRIVYSPGLTIHPSGYSIALAYSGRARHRLRTADILHVHHPFASGLLALRYRARSQPVVYTNHTRYDLYSQVYMPWVLGSLGPKMAAGYVRWFCAQAEQVVVPTPTMAKVLESWGVHESVRIVPNGVDLDTATPPQAIPRSAFGIPEGETVFVFTGRLGREKNLGLLFDAFRLHASQRPGTHLLLVGGGPERAGLERRVAEAELRGRVHFAGAIPRESVPAYLSAADAFVTASVTEVHSLSVLEALAAGLPVIAVTSPGMVESVRPGVTGLLAEASPESLAESLTRLARDAAVRQALANGAAASAEEHSSGLWARRMVAVYQEALDGIRTKPSP